MNKVRRAAEKDIERILELLVQVDMVHHNGRPDLFKGPATKYNADELKTIISDMKLLFLSVRMKTGRCWVTHSAYTNIRRKTTF